jgi:hypothetical protein
MPFWNVRKNAPAENEGPSSPELAVAAQRDVDLQRDVELQPTSEIQPDAQAQPDAVENTDANRPVAAQKEGNDERLISAATSTVNFLDPTQYGRLYQDCNTVIVVSGLLMTATYSALYAGYGSGKSGGEELQFSWFCALNHWSFCLSVVTVFTSVAGLVLLQQLRAVVWPKDCQDLPAAPDDINQLKMSTEDFGRTETYCRTLLFVWHANCYGLVEHGATFLNVLRSIWVLLLLSMVMALAAGCVALEKHVNGGKHPGLFWGAVFTVAVITALLSVLPGVLCLWVGHAATHPPKQTAGEAQGSGALARRRVITRQIAQRAIEKALPYTSKLQFTESVWMEAALLAGINNFTRVAGQSLQEECLRLCTCVRCAEAAHLHCSEHTQPCMSASVSALPTTMLGGAVFLQEDKLLLMMLSKRVCSSRQTHLQHSAHVVRSGHGANHTPCGIAGERTRLEEEFSRDIAPIMDALLAWKGKWGHHVFAIHVFKDLQLAPSAFKYRRVRAAAAKQPPSMHHTVTCPAPVGIRRSRCFLAVGTICSMLMPSCACAMQPSALYCAGSCGGSWKRDVSCRTSTTLPASQPMWHGSRPPCLFVYRIGAVDAGS